MLTAFIIILPIVAALAIIAGAPAKLTARASSLGVLGVSIAAAATHHCAYQCWSTNVAVLPTSSLPIYFSLGIDGISAVLLLLSGLVLVAAVFSGKAPEGKEKLYYASSLLIGAGAIGAFVSTDAFFFYAFHELALIPTFLMIGMLGRGPRREVAWRTTIYLAAGSIVLLAGILWAAIELGTFNLNEMAERAAAMPITPATQASIAALLIVGFGTLVSLFPFHSWAAPAYASAPAPTAMLHAGVLKKFGLYGLIRFLPIVPDGFASWLDVLLILLLGNILWVGFVTLNQKRLDLLLGNSSVMHMGYIFLAIAAFIGASEGNPNDLAIPAALTLMFAHGISIALLFGLADRIESRTGTLDITQLGGLAKPAPHLAFLFGLAGMASIGLPGLANFSGELMVFLSGFHGWQADGALGPVQIATILALWGVVISAVYMLRAYRRIFQGEQVRATEQSSDLNLLERVVAIFLALALLTFGIYPQLLLNLLY